ncbi:MAG: hypothetical protein ACQEP7_01190 [bacterium]
MKIKCFNKQCPEEKEVFKLKGIHVAREKSGKFNKKTIYITAVIFSLLFFLPVRSVMAESTEQNLSKVIHFFEQKKPPRLAKPGSIYEGPGGQIAVYDKHLHKFEFFPARRGKTLDWESFIDQEARAHKFKRWGLGEGLQGAWADSETFWCYDPKIATGSDTVFMFNLFDPADTMVLPGPIEDIKFKPDAWYIQRPPDKFEKRQPVYRGDIIDTAQFTAEGNFVGQLANGSYVFRVENRVYLYRDENDTSQKSFSGLRAVQTAGKYIYVLLAEGKILKLNRNFEEKFSFEIIGNFNFRDFVLTGGSAYFTARSGLYKADLDESERSFFYATATVQLKEVSKSEVKLFDKSKKRAQRIWSDSEEIYLWQNGRSRVVSVHEEGLTQAKKVKDESSIPLLAFQYFQSPHTTWDGRVLYYYFPREQLVESYDKRGGIKRKTFLENPPEYLENVQFTGAGQDYILMGGELLKSSGEKVKAFAVYNWSGKLQRIFQPEHPAEDNLAPQPEGYPHYEYSGGELVYAFYSDHIQTYDLYGYPGQKIGDLVYPEDIARYGNKLYVLDGRGYRLSQQTGIKSPNIRFASSSALGNIEEGYRAADDDIILSVSSRDKNFLTRYNPQELKTNKFLEHPQKSLRYPVVSGQSDTIYFWGTEPQNNEFQLYRFDSKRYVAEELDYSENLRARAGFDDYKNILLVPREPDESDTNLFSYFDVSTGTSGIIKNTRDLELLISAEQYGYRGVKKEKGSYEIVDGVVKGDPDSGFLQWEEGDTYFRVNYPVQQFDIIEDKFLLALKENPRQTGLYYWPAGSKNGQDTRVTPKNYFSGYGKLRWLDYSSNKKILLWSGANRGRLVNSYSTPPEPGGVAGEVIQESPGTAEGVKLLTQPGGQITTTNSGGNFTLDGVQTGYLEIYPPSYRHHFEQPLEVLVNPAEYTVNQAVALYPLEELGLLERGLENYRRSKFGRARIALEAFRSLVGEGPYFSWTARPLLEVYRSEENTRGMYQLYSDNSAAFDSDEKYLLWNRLEKSNQERKILNELLQTLAGGERRIVKYILWRNLFLQGKTEPGKYLRYPLPAGSN